MTKSRIDLNDLRIEERPARGGGRAILLVLLLLLIPAAFVAGWVLKGDRGGLGGGPLPVRTEAARRGAAPAAGASSDGFSEGGWVEVPSYHPIVVSALVPGRVEELLVLEGSPVTAGDVVARLYAKDLADALRLEESRVAEAAARLALLTAGYRTEDVAKARAEVARTREEVDFAQKVATRTRQLVPSGAASPEELDRDESALGVARARLSAATSELDRLVAGFRKEEVDEARAAFARAEASRDLAKSRLGYAEVKSTASGIVMERFVTPGTFLSAAKPAVVSLYDPEDLQVRVDIRQENAPRVRVGQEALVTTDAEPEREYRAEVIRLEPVADFKKNTIQAKLKILDPGPGLYPEMICRIRFQTSEAPAAEPGTRPAPLTVSATALVREEGRSFVFQVRDGRAVRMEVRVGEERGGRVEVLGGLTEGARVIVAPPPGLADGEAVTESAR